MSEDEKEKNALETDEFRAAFRRMWQEIQDREFKNWLRFQRWLEGKLND